MGCCESVCVDYINLVQDRGQSWVAVRVCVWITLIWCRTEGSHGLL